VSESLLPQRVVQRSGRAVAPGPGPTSLATVRTWWHHPSGISAAQVEVTLWQGQLPWSGTSLAGCNAVTYVEPSSIGTVHADFSVVVDLLRFWAEVRRGRASAVHVLGSHDGVCGRVCCGGEGEGEGENFDVLC
jgi:hypothetical protein